MRIVSTLLGATLLGVSLIAPAPVKAIEWPVNSQRLGAVMPYTGTYIDWSVAGVSMEFDVGPQGTSYGSFFLVHTFDAAGNQINWIGQPNLVPTDEAERVATGVIARASGDLYYATNGPCIGCAAHDQTIVQTGVHFALAWATPRSVTMTLSGAQTGEFHLTAANFAGQDDSQFLSGTWAATSVIDWSVAERDPNAPPWADRSYGVDGGHHDRCGASGFSIRVVAHGAGRCVLAAGGRSALHRHLPGR